MLERIIRESKLTDVPIVLIAAIAIISIWRGLWNLMDLYLVPNNFLHSQIASITLGVLILITLSWVK